MEISETMKAQQSRTTGTSLTRTTKGFSGVHVRDMELSLTTVKDPLVYTLIKKSFVRLPI